MSPVLDDEEYVFATLRDEAIIPLLKPICILQETVGTSVICRRAAAQFHGIAQSATVFRKITLTVHSSLEAVGLTAAVSSELAKHDIPCNVVAGFHHDHLFVPSDRAVEALEVLKRMK